ncbi:monosaccharide ABC transporter ATP-binding protein, CUT2 family [Streptomyces zhaozhouensis]|uniref:Monosaccharide ABC transporter ATP-binding protein, CUT2 family n=1 Tax=Streptomyces zhaozhouensis TaxID=1300267 RepID=A0A286DXR8_9ACTN|nr:sugar ABC transporter ATP-binding protein [Streptomyces zhaozhouensis]SOD63426.1 monosaccharide ABC transporter ATP-binding protein, CUT2 family [Streptomyces zhaozhouensis]
MAASRPTPEGHPARGEHGYETPRDAPPPPVVALRDVWKSYGAVAALRGAHIELHAGEAHALVGENGAGKSTLIKVLAGVRKPDRGVLELDGVRTEFKGPQDARAAGVAVIHQEPALFPDLSVAENVFAGRQPRGRFGRIDERAMRERAHALLARLGVPLDPRRPARGLSIADQQIVEIAKAVSLETRALVMDEPTAALSGPEVDRLFSVVNALRAESTAVLFVSHRFAEVTALCQRVTVLRDGAHVSTGPLAETSVDRLVAQMVGREPDALFVRRREQRPPGDVVLEVEGLSRAGAFRDVGFHVRAGEIVALAGLVGAGRSEVARAVFGVDRRDAGRVTVAGRTLPGGRPRAAMAAGLALVPEDRRQQGLVLAASVQRNATLPRARQLSRFGFLVGGAERRAAREWAGRLRTRYGDLDDPVGTLSGGNQQKVVLAKWLATAPRVLIVDEPTRGIDIGTKAEVHRLLARLAADGVAILLISSELPEVLGMADRVLVMREGRLVADLPREAADEESVIRAATGQEAPA